MDAQSVLDTMPNPDDVGTSEYRMVHEHITDVIASSAAERPLDVLDLVASSLAELAEVARTAQRTFALATAGTEVERRLLDMDRELDVLVAAGDSVDVHEAAAFHAHLRNANRKISGMPEGADKERCTTLCTDMARRLLTTVFQINVEDVERLMPSSA